MKSAPRNAKSPRGREAQRDQGNERRTPESSTGAVFQGTGANGLPACAGAQVVPDAEENRSLPSDLPAERGGSPAHRDRRKSLQVDGRVLAAALLLGRLS